MDTNAYIIEKYKLEGYRRMPVEIPNMGRNNLPELFNELGFTTGAEIGVASGRFSKILCEGMPNLFLYCVDAWKVYAPDYRDYTDQALLTGLYEDAKKRLAPYNIKFIKNFSMNALKSVEDESLDFVYIDANHEYPFVTLDLVHWTKKVRPGGIIAGHDYYESNVKKTKCQVIPALQGYTRAYKIYPWYVIGTKAKTPGLIRDTSRSWMFVK